MAESKNEELSHAEKTRPRLNEAEFVVLHSGVRKRHTRFKRLHQAMANRARFVQKVAGGDIIVRRNRPARVLVEKLKEHLEEIREKVDAGLLEVRSPTGQILDLDSLEPTSEPRPAPNRPNPVRTEHMPVGRPIPAIPGGKAQTEKVAPPKVTQTGLPDGDEPTKEELYEEAKELEVEGRSSMNKEELAEAVEEAQAELQEESKKASKKSKKSKK